jgi:hypothetical protein
VAAFFLLTRGQDKKSAYETVHMPARTDLVSCLEQRVRLSVRHFVGGGLMAMDDRIIRLQAHQRSIDRYERLLRSNLSAIELRFVEQRLLEERQALATLQLVSPSTEQGSLMCSDSA